MIFFGFMYLTIRRYIVPTCQQSWFLIRDPPISDSWLYNCDSPTVRYYVEKYIAEALSNVNWGPRISVETSREVWMFSSSVNVNDS